MLHAPGQFFALVRNGHLEFDQMADGRGNIAVLVLEIVLLLFEFSQFRQFSQNPCQVGGDTGFFSDYHELGHKTMA